MAYTLWQHTKNQSGPKLAIVATSLDDLLQKLSRTREVLSKSTYTQIHDPRGIYLAEKPLAQEGKIAFLFPGQGSQYLDMLRDLAIHFPEVRERFELADHILADRFSKPLSTYVFPPPRFRQEDETNCQEALMQTNIAQPAIGAADMGIFHLLQTLGVKPDMVAGHSYGEYVALCAAGVFSEEMLYTISEARGRFILEAARKELGTMAAVEAPQKSIAAALHSIKDVWIANLNAPRQTIISGTHAGINEAISCLEAQGIKTRPVAVTCAFHSPHVAPARDRLADFLSHVVFDAPRLEVFSNTSALTYPKAPEAIVSLLSEHLVRPIDFIGEIEAMYDAGARIFVEVGPRNVLVSLIKQILGDRPYLALASDGADRSGLIQLHHLLGQLTAHGVSLQCDRLYSGRMVRQLNLDALVEETMKKPLSQTTWLVDGSRARPLRDDTKTKALMGSPTNEKTANTPKVQTPIFTAAKSSAVSSTTQGQAFLPQMPAAPSVAIKASGTTDQPHSTAPSFTTLPSASDEASRVMLQFQQLMNRFLETQQQVMLAYLQGSTDGATRSSEGSTVATLSEASMPSSPQAIMATELNSPPPLTPTSEERESSKLDDSDAATPFIASSPAPSSFSPKLQYLADKQKITEKLLQIVGERTGYPSEMLGLDLNLEADLGIDSIKRVEILGAFQRACFPLDRGQTKTAMDELTKIKTLRGIIDYMSEAVQSRQEASVDESKGEQRKAAEARIVADSDSSNGEVEVPRFVLTAVDAPLSKSPLQLVQNAVFLITDAENGVAQIAADKLRQCGGRVALVRMGSKNIVADQDTYTADLTDSAAVAELLKIIHRQYGPLAGIIHLLPLQSGTKFAEMNLADWRDRLDIEVKSLFCLVKVAGSDLKQAGQVGMGWLVAATSMDGTFASNASESDSFFPSQGGVAGLVKTLALEWPQVRSKVIDFDASVPPAELADHLIAEILMQDNDVEVGYRSSRRLVLRPNRTPLSHDGPAGLTVDSSWVLLVTGGARGITAEVACELAVRYRPTLLIVGRSPLPELEESPQTVGLTSHQALKAVLMEQMRRTEQPVAPMQVETAYSRLLRDREIRNNLATIERAGARVRYYQVDVRDDGAFGKLIDEIYQSYGRIDGVVHGAGIIEDKLIEDKTVDSFERVFETKVISAFVLSRKLRPDSLKFLLFFSSIAGRFGNRGQSDYAAANEVLSKLAVYLDHQWPGLVKAINWGPWKKTGMVSAELERQFAERAVQLINPEAGRRALDHELRYGSKGEVEVILGGGPWDNPEEKMSHSSLSSSPLLNGVPLLRGNGGSVEVVYRFDTSDHIYLQDHQLDAKPVLPAAMAMELMAEVVQKGWPEWKVIGVRALHVLKGIIFENDRKSVRVVARPQTQPSQEHLVLEVDVAITELEQSGHLCYRATVLLAERLPEPPLFELPPHSGLGEFPSTVDEAYRRWLFHGPRFQCISTIDGINDRGIVATVVPSSPKHCLANPGAAEWLIDPIVIDSGPQFAIIWTRLFKDMTALPSNFRNYRYFGSLTGAMLRCYFEVLPSSDDHMLNANVFFVSLDGRLLGLLEGLESISSQSLNRLSGSDKE